MEPSWKKAGQRCHIVTALFDPGPSLDLFLFCIYDENLLHHTLLMPGCDVLLGSTNHNSHGVNPLDPGAKINVSSFGHPARCLLIARPVS